MREHGPSATARRVAAYRSRLERLAAPYGDPAADHALAEDVAGDTAPGRSEAMARYLRLRTGFFDRVTVNALDRGVAQVVVVGAGYDGRALRYAKPGTRWWEVDHPATQADKRARLDRLGLAVPGVTFVAHDLEDDGLADALVGRGFEADAPSLFACEGVALYLTPAAVARLLADLRTLATPGTRLALSVALTGADGDTARSRLDGALAALGEPVVSRCEPGELAGRLRRGRWRAVELSERSRRAGLVVAAPVWVPAPAGTAPSRGRIARFAERMLERTGADRLADHLAAAHGVEVRSLRELDLGVHRVELADGARWVARVFPACRPEDAARSDARLLDWLAGAGIPAERCPTPDPVSVLEGQAVLVTELVAGRPLSSTAPASFALLGRLLGRLHAMATDLPAARRPGGAWHHLALDASPATEVASVRELLDDARHRVPAGGARDYATLVAAAEALDGLADLPHAFVHPDPVPRNTLRPKGGDPVLIDWAGCGRGPRVASLGCLLWAAAPDRSRVAAALAGYRASVVLSPAELDHLGPALRLRPLVLACWTFATGRDQLARQVRWWTVQERNVDAAVGHALAAMAQPAPGPDDGR